MPLPEASFDLGLDVMAIAAYDGRRDHSHDDAVAHGPARQGHGHCRSDHMANRLCDFHDLSEFTLSASSPVGFQVDGDFIGERNKVRFTSVPAAIRVVCANGVDIGQTRHMSENAGAGQRTVLH